jgi:hypothetical protein
MVHLVHAIIILGRMMRPVRLPVSAIGAPLRETIEFANKDIFAVERLKTGAVGFVVSRGPRSYLDVGSVARSLITLLLEGFPFGCPWHKARVELNRYVASYVGCDHEKEEDRIQCN